MPRKKDLKRLVRARMKKTGEAYTAARAHILRKGPGRTASRDATLPRATRAATAPDVPRPSDYATVAGMSDTSLKKKTGRTWDEWVDVLDREGAVRMLHRDIAELVNTKYDVDGWWSQMVTVGYERIKGLRARGQRRDGTYEASKSRTFGVPVSALFDAWADASARKRWLNEPGLKIRTATAPKSMRLGWSDGSIVAVGFSPKGETKSSVAVQHTKLSDRETAERLKAYWSERLEALGTILQRK